MRVVANVITDVGEIEILTESVRRGAAVWWRWAGGDVHVGPFSDLKLCRRDAGAAAELTRKARQAIAEQHQRRAARR